MARYRIKEFLELLREIIPDEINAETLHFFLRMELYTARRLLNGGTLWPSMTRWRQNAFRMTKEEDKKYDKYCERVLKGRQKNELSETEKKQLRKCVEEYEKDREDRLEERGILQLQCCCYDPDEPSSSEFERLLLELVEEILCLAEEYRGTSGKECVLDFLRQNHGTQADLNKIEVCSSYRAMARFLVAQVDKSHEKTEDRLKLNGIESNVDISDQLYIPPLALPRAGTTAGQPGWIGVSFNLHDKNWHEVGNWSFLSLTEEQLEKLRKGSCSEASCADLPFAPGEYIFYRIQLSGLPDYEITSPLDMQRLVDAMWIKLLFYAKKGVYIKGLYFRISDMDAARENLYRDLGFHFAVEDYKDYVQKLVPFPASFRTAEPEILAELKDIYDRRFLSDKLTS